jgi:TolA-binding protein
VKSSICQIKTTVDNIRRQNQAEERISVMEDKIEEILHLTITKKMDNYNYNL